MQKSINKLLDLDWLFTQTVLSLGRESAPHYAGGSIIDIIIISSRYV